MTRSRRRASRGLIVVLVVAVGVAAVCVYRKRSSTTLSAVPPLSAVDVTAPIARNNSIPILPQTQPSTSISAVINQVPPPIETSTPTSLDSSAIVASATVAPTSRPVADTTEVRHPGEAGWSKLLTTGSADGSNPAAAAPATQPITTGNGVLADARARIAAGTLLDARVGLNDAIQAGSLSEADNTAAMALLSDISQTVVFSPKTFINDPYAAAYVVHSGDSLAKIAAAHQTTWELLSTINHLDPRRLRAGSTIKVLRGPFFAVVRKAAFCMDVYLGGLPGEKGSMYVTTFQVGLGKDDSTPTGTWAIGAHAKLKHPTYYPPQGGQPIEADDPKNPLGGYWIALTGVDGQAVGRTSYGIHGTIDPESIGKQASMGCIRLKNADIAMVFDLMVEGKSVVLVK